MKKLLAVLGALAVAAVAQANVWNFEWRIGYAYSPDDGVTADILSDYAVTWSLIDAASGNPIWGFDSVNGELVFDDMANGGGYGNYSSELFADSGTFTYLGNPDPNVYPVGDTSVRMRIELFGDNGDWIWESDPQTITIQTSGENPGDAPWGTVVLGSSASTDPSVNATWTAVTSVPEPATMSLLGLGALAMVLRRKVRK